MSEPTREEIERFGATVISRLGFSVDDHNAEHAAQVLRHRLRRTGSGSVASYIERFADPSFAQEELREVAAELSVAETYFFRHPEQIRAMREAALPELVRARQSARRLRVLSAGCASGEEPYSLAAAIRTALAGASGWEVRIWGIDVNPRLLKKAAQARYRAWSLRAMTEEQRQRYFHVDGQDHVLAAEIRSMVTFEERNLLDDDPSFWRADYFDVIFCRNVMIYFTRAAVAQAIERMTHALAPGGFLFLGPSETLRGISHEFHLRHTYGAFYYQRRHPGETAQRPGSARNPVEMPRKATPAPPVPGLGEESWVSAISQAAGRIAALAEKSGRHSQKIGSAAAGGASQEVVAAAAGDHPLEPARKLFRQERFADALRELHALPAQSEPDPDALLLRAVLLANTGQVTEAQEVCRRLLIMDELNAGAHYLMAVCQEHLGDLEAAAEHDQTAIYLDPEFAMPRLHLGLLAKRQGELATARGELGEALELLAREDGSRILLFGGGFHRDALVRYCQSQLRSCGGPS